MMYRDEDEFVRAQKIKLILAVILIVIAFACGNPLHG